MLGSWVAFETAGRAIQTLVAKNDMEVVASNLVFVIEQLRGLLFTERDRLAETVFRAMLRGGDLKLIMISDKPLRSKATVRSKRSLYNEYEGQPLQRSLFDYVPKEDMNNLEEQVALYLDGQQQLLWWYRNMSKQDYRIQGWKPNRIYPDFLAAERSDGEQFDKLYILESKGDQLAGNEDTEYKRTVLELCNDLAVEANWAELDLGQQGVDFHFETLDEKSWKSQLNALISKA